MLLKHDFLCVSIQKDFPKQKMHPFNSLPIPCLSSASSSLVSPILRLWPLRLAIQLSLTLTRNFLSAAWRCWRNGDDSLLRFSGIKLPRAEYSTCDGASLVFGLQHRRFRAARRMLSSREERARLRVFRASVLFTPQRERPLMDRWALMTQAHAWRWPGTVGSRADSKVSKAPGNVRNVEGRRWQEALFWSRVTSEVKASRTFGCHLWAHWLAKSWSLGGASWDELIISSRFCSWRRHL